MRKSALVMSIIHKYAPPSLIVSLLFYLNLLSSTLNSVACCESQQGDVSSSKSTEESIGQLQTCPLSFISLPTGKPRFIPRIQHQFDLEIQSHRVERIKRQQAVRKAFQHSWNGYKSHAWLWDEVLPISGGQTNTLGGWAATLVDSLDTLFIMNLDDEFGEALKALDKINFSTARIPSINVFETKIRYLGGLISAYDLSEGKHPILLKKAHELGDFLYGAFDTPNKMPQTRWPWVRNLLETSARASENTLLAEIGSLSLEFTRLSQITGDPKYFDAVQRITDNLQSVQNRMRLPGLWSVSLDAREFRFTDRYFTVGGMADSVYEYLAKEYLLLGAQSDQYRAMYIDAMEGIKKHLLFQGMDKADSDILFAGNIRFDPISGKELFEYQTEHLKCFLGGMAGFGARVFGREADLTIARKLVNGCIWAYDLMPVGIMPETVYISGCRKSPCKWEEEKWLRDIFGWPEEEEMPTNLREAARIVVQEHQLQPPILEVTDAKYLLRPEAIESMFILYRITGDASLQDTAWRMFQNIEQYTKTKYGYAALEDTRDTQTARLDLMESFWLAETLKYFYLIFSDPDLISLDVYVLNTEGHRFKYVQVSPTMR